MCSDYSKAFQGTPQELDKARRSISEYLQNSLRLGRSQIIDIEIAVGEVIQNIVRYGYCGGNPEKNYQIQIFHEDSHLRFEIKDFAEPIQHLDFLSKKYEPSEGGKMGISIINKIVSNYSIHPQSDGNLHTLTILKN